MQKYFIAGLCAALLVLGWLYRSASTDLVDTKTALSVAEGVNKANAEATARLERSMGNTDDVLAGWNEDRTTLAGVRSAARQAIKEAMRDETFKAWASSLVPVDAWRLLNAPSDAHKDGAGSAGSPGQPDAGLPGNGNTTERVKR